MTSQTPEATEIEEVVKEFGKLKALSMEDGSIKTNIKKCEDWLRTTLLSQQQKHRETWLREEIVKLEEDLRMNGGDVRIEAICKRLKDSIKNTEK